MKPLFVKLLVLLVLFLIFYAFVTWMARRNQVESYTQVSMINNSGPGDDEMPVFYPKPMCKPKKKCPKMPTIIPNNIPTPQPNTPTFKGPDLPPLVQPPHNEIPHTNEGSPLPRMVPPRAAPSNPPKAQPTAPLPLEDNKKPSVTYECAKPQYTVCEVVPAPKVSMHVFRFMNTSEGKQALEKEVSNFEDMFVQDDEKYKPKLLQTEEEWLSVPYLQHVGMSSLPFKSKAPIDGFDIVAGKGCSLVVLARLQNTENADYTLMGLGDMYKMNVHDFRYYIRENKWMLFIKVWRQGDNNDGMSIHTFLDAVDDKDEISIQQMQNEIIAQGIDALHVCKAGKVLPSVMAKELVCELAYAGVYDRALQAGERHLIWKSVEEILRKQPLSVPSPKAIVEYNMLAMEGAPSPSFEYNKVKDSSIVNSFDLIMNSENTDNVGGRYRFNPFTHLVLTKADKFFTQSSSYLEFPDGYSIEIMFVGTEFSETNPNILFCYATPSEESAQPQMIVNVSPTDTDKGNLMSVIFFTRQKDVGRIESSLRISPGRWYHVVITSESQIFINGMMDPKPRGRSVTHFPSATGRYITIGDYKNPDVYVATTDYGNTIHGNISVARVYNTALNQSQVDGMFDKVRQLLDPQDAVST